MEILANFEVPWLKVLHNRQSSQQAETLFVLCYWYRHLPNDRGELEVHPTNFLKEVTI